MIYTEDIRNNIPAESREEFIPVDIPGAELAGKWGIQLAGISDLTEGYQMGRRDCPFTVLICVLSGEGFCYFDGKPHALKEGNILMIRFGEDHIYRASGTWRILWFHLDCCFRKETESPFFIRSDGELIQSLYRISLTFLRESQGERNGMILYNLGSLIALMIRRILAYPSSGVRQSRDRQIIERLRREASRDLSRDWTVGELAELANITPSYLFKITGRTLDLSPQGFVTQMKMELAVQLLNHSDYPLKYIADRLGYSTPYAFSKAFRKRYGVSPGAFRNGERS